MEATMTTGTTRRRTYVLALALALATALFLVLAMGALGIVGDGGRADRIFLAVPLVLVVGALVARLRPTGMAVALLATAATQAVACVVVVVAVAAGVDDYAGASIVDIVMVSAMYAALFGGSAWLFRRSAGQGSAQNLHA
jgi:hypothetical protein